MGITEILALITALLQAASLALQVKPERKPRYKGKHRKGRK